MKHYVVSLTAGARVFDYKCSRINEAYDAVLEASAAFDINIDLDDVMSALVRMKEGSLLSQETGRIIRLTVREGEV